MFEQDEKFVAIDADSVDVNLRKVIIKACTKFSINALFVADRFLQDVATAHINSKNICQVIVNSDFDSADNYIFNVRDRIYFCITHDKILQKKLNENGVEVLDKRGNTVLDNSTPYKKLTNKDVQKFSDTLYSLLNKLCKK